MLDEMMQSICRPQSQFLRSYRRICIHFGTFLVLGLFAYSTLGQNYLTSTGSPSFGAPEPVELGFVDASNGNLHLSIPLGSYPQRGTSQPQKIALEYDSSIWAPLEISGTIQWYKNESSPGWLLGGWYYSFDAAGNAEAQIAQGCWTDITWSDQNGTTHTFHVNFNSVGGQGCPATGDAFATDSSGYHLYSTTTGTKVYAPDGTLVFTDTLDDPLGRHIMAEDSNGNYMSLNNDCIYDTLGRLLTSDGTFCDDTVTTLATSQGTANYSITDATINVNTDFQQQGVQETSTTITVIRSITLPDAEQSTYYFTYDCDSSTGNAACGSPSGQSAYYGELIGITLPTGGQVNYSYTTFKDAYSNMSQWVQSRSAASGFWGYSPQVLSMCTSTQVNCKQQTTVTTPTGQTIYTFQLNNGAWPTTIIREDLQGNVQSTVTNTWDYSQSCVTINCYGNSFVRLLSQQTTVPATVGNLTKQTAYTYDSPQQGNQTAIKEWGYYLGGSFPSVPDRATYISYLSTGTNDINRPLSVTLCNNSGTDTTNCPGGGSRVSQTQYTYDCYSGTGCTALATVSGVAQHDDTDFGASYTTRGNPTSISKWVSGSTYLTTNYTYDTTGQVVSAKDSAGNITQYFYTDNFYTDPGNGNAPGSYSPQMPTNAYVTSVTDAVGTQTLGYYWGSGKTAIATDYNKVSTTNHYQDGLDRQTEEIDPVGWSLATYSSATQSDMYTAVADMSPSIACVSCQHTRTNLDSWGRTASQILVNNPIGPVEVDSAYDADERLYTQSHPHSGIEDPNNVLETFSYDALDRQISTTHPDGQAQQAAYGPDIAYFGGVTSQQGATATYGYGYPQVSMDESGHLRQQWLDGFGNIIEVDEPSTSTTTSVAATATVGIVTGSGAEWQSIDPCEPHSSCPQTVPNSGTVSLTIDGFTSTGSYGATGPDPDFSSANSVASALAAGFNSDPTSPVTASVSGATILLTAKGPGASGDLAFSTSSTYYSGSCSSTGGSCFGGPAYVISPSSGTLSGGAGGLGASPYYTNYTYDIAGHLTQVIQGVQTRTFQYDGLGRKTYENTPEGGTVTYAYTANGGGLCSGDPSNVCTRTDARGVVSTYTYDHANRLTGVAYTIPSGQSIATMPNVCTTVPNGTAANVCEYYDQGGASAFATGRLTEMVDATGSESYNHDANGRVKQLSKVIGGQTYSIGYQYDASGDVTQITYPSGRVVQQAYNLVGQLCQIAPLAANCAAVSSFYAANFSYNAPGKLTSFNYGNGVTGTFYYSPDRMQLTYLAYTKGTSTYFNLQYSYEQSSAYSPPCPNGTIKNNGSVQCIMDNVDSGRSVGYSYDPIQRMASAKSCGSTAFPQWGLSESYDRFGNRLTQAVTAGSGPSANMSFSSNNQPTGYTYDPSGNMTVEPLSPPNNMTYDGENRMTAFSGNGGAASYTYDGNGMRVVKSLSGGTTTVSIYSGSSVIAEYDNGAAPSAPSREYVTGPSGLLAMFAGGATTYYHQDHLSVRLTTDGTSGSPTYGQVLSQEGSFPFGEQWYESGAANKWSFTSYDRDSESGLDYALARYYNSRTGTFCSADPLAGSPGDPQSWNRYPYGRNDPIDVTDPSGKSWWSSLLIDIGVAVAAYFAPEAISALFPAADDVDAAQAALASGHVAESSFVPQLVTRGATAGISAGVDAGAAGVSGSLGAGLAGAAAAQAAQSDGQSNPQQGHGPIAPNVANQKTDCEHKILNATNNHFGTSFNSNNVTGEFQYSTGAPAGQGTLNLNIAGSQAANVTAGRYPLHWWSYVIGYGSTLHVPTGPGGADSPMTLRPTANQFTAHLDSAYPYGIGFAFHYFQDMKGVGGYKPCPR
jgi:RHS repeat-associated protein